MSERDDLASVSEPTAITTAHEEQIQDGKDDVGEVMVEVVGSDVFVDGVGSDGGSGNWDTEDGVDVNTNAKLESGEAGNFGQIGAFDSSSRKTCTELEGMVGVTASPGQICQKVDEIPEGDGMHLFDREVGVVDKEALASQRADEVEDGEAVAGSLPISSASTREHTNIHVDEEVEDTVVQETGDSEMVEEGLVKIGSSANEINCTLTGANPGVAVFSSPLVEETSSVQDQAEDCENIDENYAVHPNAEAEVTVSEVSMMSKEEITNSHRALFCGIDDQQQLPVDMSSMDVEEQDATRETVGDIEEMIVDQTTVESDRQQLQVDMSAMEGKEQISTRDTVGDKDTMIVDQTTLGSDDAIASDIKDLKSEVSVCAVPHLSNQQTVTDTANEKRLDISKDDQTPQIEFTLDNDGEHGQLESSTEQASNIEMEDVAEMDKVDEKNEIMDVNDSLTENCGGMKAVKFGGTVSVDDIAHGDSSLGKGPLGKGNCDPPILENELCSEVGTLFSDDSKFTGVQPAETSIADTAVDQGMDLLLSNDASNVEGHVHIASLAVIDSSVSLDEKIDCHSSQHIIADVQPLSNDIPLQDGNHESGSCIMEMESSTIIVEQTSEENILDKEETGGTTQVEVQNESTVCNLVVDLDTYMNKEGVCNSLDDESKENVSFVDKSHFVDEIQPMDSEMCLQVSDGLDGSGTELYFDGYTLEVDVDEGGIGLEQLEMEEEAAGEEQVNDDDDIDPKLTNMMDANISRVHQPSYFLPPETGEFSVSDLVWGKVKSHPWWPGQIFDSSDASDKAIKYHKKDSFLVAYFGDRTFAWNEASVLKPFRAHFSQAERHSSSEALQNAVSCALEEVSRRVELGLYCPCMPIDVFDKIEAQIIENTGIREQSSRRPGIDKSMGANSFQADKLLDFVKELAELPLDGSDRFNLVVAKAQLLAFNRQRGCQQLPEFQTCEALQENEMDFSESTDKTEHVTEGESRINLKIEKSNTNKRKHNLKDVMYPSKKDRSLSDLMGEERRISFYSAKVSTTSPLTPKPSFKMGDCIRRAASQLTANPSILKPNNDAFSIDESIESPMGPDTQNPQGSGSIFSMESCSVAEMLAQLHLVAVDPKKVYNSMSAISTFFSGYRNSISVHFSGRQSTGGVRKRKASQPNGSPEDFEFDEVNDSYWAERVIQNGSEEQATVDGQDRVVYQPVILNGSIKSGRRPYRKRFSNGVSEIPLDGLAKADVERKAENAPAELVLNFSENDLIPVETSLNKIFRRFGPIQELETEVDPESCRARVVFKRCSDAEVAFSSAGAFNIFGPMIVNYQLNYTPSSQFKSLPLALLEGQEDAT